MIINITTNIIIIINILPPGAGDRELGGIRIELALLAFLLLFFLLRSSCLLFSSFLCGPTLDNDENADAEVAKSPAVFCLHFSSEPDKRNVSVRRGPGRC